MNFKHTTLSILKLAGFFVLLNFITRIILLCMPITDVHFPIIDYVKIFFFGFVNDVCVALAASVLMEICLIIMPKIRQNISYGIYCVLFFVYIFFYIFNACSEYFFWDEYGLRYNFIAVDYLVYIHEVIGNILESFPTIQIVAALTLISAAITYLFIKKSKKYFADSMNFKLKIVHFSGYAAIFILSVLILNLNKKFETSDSVYANELQANGLWKFYKATQCKSLLYEKFYLQIPENEAFEIIDNFYNFENNIKIINDSLPEIKKNIVLVTMESMSGNYLAHFGNKEGITPNLDKLADEGIFFTQLFSAGNRTVRGLEAYTLCLPPSAGESLIKRSDNGDFFSTGSVFRQKGYATQFLYCGFSYFDNMKSFYENNDYQIIDRDDFEEDEITFANIWGVCDEDMFDKALKIFDENSQNEKPFFAQIMSVSNHRPYTYPNGKIDISPNIKSQAGGVKYADYAIGKFIEKAKLHSWFDNTIFIFASDHCATSEGNVSIPLEKYHIPVIIYAPNFIEPQKVEKVASQIDVMPTIFGLLHFSYESRFYGQNVFSADYQPRALVATFQDLGYFRDNILTILSPAKKVVQYEIKSDSAYNFPATKMSKLNQTLANEAAAHYQTVDILVKNGKLKIWQ